MHLQLAQPLLFLLQPFELGLAHAAESAFEDELHDLMQLASIEKRPVRAARIDDRRLTAGRSSDGSSSFRTAGRGDSGQALLPARARPNPSAPPASAQSRPVARAACTTCRRPPSQSRCHRSSRIRADRRRRRQSSACRRGMPDIWSRAAAPLPRGCGPPRTQGRTPRLERAGPCRQGIQWWRAATGSRGTAPRPGLRARRSSGNGEWRCPGSRPINPMEAPRHGSDGFHQGRVHRDRRVD